MRGLASGTRDARQSAVSPLASKPSEVLQGKGTIELVSGMIDDAHELVGGHVEALGSEMRDRLVTLGATLTSLLIAISIMIVTGLLLALAIAVSLVELGVPLWIAMWAITVAAATVGLGFARRARTKAHATGDIATRATKRAATDVAWIGDRANSILESEQ